MTEAGGRGGEWGLQSSPDTSDSHTYLHFSHNQQHIAVSRRSLFTSHGQDRLDIILGLSLPHNVTIITGHTSMPGSAERWECNAMSSVGCKDLLDNFLSRVCLVQHLPGPAAGHSPQTLVIDSQQQVACNEDVTPHHTHLRPLHTPGFILPSAAVAPEGSKSRTRQPLSFQANASASSPESEDSLWNSPNLTQHLGKFCFLHAQKRRLLWKQNL